MELDPYGLGFTGYTTAEAEAILAAAETDVPLIQTLDCVHRGAFLKIGRCNLCETDRGEAFEILGCELHGQCSMFRRHRKVKACVSCPDRKPLDQPEPERHT